MKLRDEVVQFFTQGNEMSIEDLMSATLYDCPDAQEVVVKDISFVSLCEHHLLPMFGVCHIAYLTNQKVLGLGRISEIVEIFSRRLQLQEKLTHEIAAALLKITGAKGVAVTMETKHFCMVLKGLDKLHQSVVTSCCLGEHIHWRAR